MNNEWRLLADLTELKQYINCTVEDFWIKNFEMKNPLDECMFPNLSKLVQGIFSLPHSSVCAENFLAAQLNEN